jgi:hypothetical protein
VIADADPWNDLTADPEEGARADHDIPRQRTQLTDVRRPTDTAVVIDGRAGVDDRKVVDERLSVQHGTGHHGDASPQLRRWRDYGSRMDCRHQLEADSGQDACETLADLICSDGDERSLITLGAEATQVSVALQHSDAEAIVRAVIGTDTDVHALTHLPKDFDDDLRMATRADDNDTQAHFPDYSRASSRKPRRLNGLRSSAMSDHAEGTWLPIQYRGFYDVPLSILVEYRGFAWLLDLRFDDILDEYADQYSLYRLEGDTRRYRDDPKSDWTSLPSCGVRIGSVPVARVRFDSTRRQSVHSDLFNHVE